MQGFNNLMELDHLCLKIVKGLLILVSIIINLLKMTRVETMIWSNLITKKLSKKFRLILTETEI